MVLGFERLGIRILKADIQIYYKQMVTLWRSQYRYEMKDKQYQKCDENRYSITKKRCYISQYSNTHSGPYRIVNAKSHFSFKGFGGPKGLK